MKIYDCFNFFNELDILELRLNILNDSVDYFVIVESSVKHSGEIKPFYFEENKERYSKFLDKIIHFKVYDTPERFDNLESGSDETLNQIYNFANNQPHFRFCKHNQPDYGRDFFQKECVRRPLVNCKDEDVIIISDLDEIPNPDILTNIKSLDFNNIYRFNQNMYCYYLNVLKEHNWFGSRILSYQKLKNLSVNEIRGDNSLSLAINNGGWHFSFMGGEEMVKNKIKSYSARDLGSDRVFNSIKSNMENNIDPFFRGNLQKVEIDNSYPEYLLKNLDKYKHLIK